MPGYGDVQHVPPAMPAPAGFVAEFADESLRTIIGYDALGRPLVHDPASDYRLMPAAELPGFKRIGATATVQREVRKRHERREREAA